jgi:hypothetical protein
MGLYVKLQRPWNFYNFQNYFPIEKVVEYDHSLMDRVDGLSSWVYDIVD